MEQCCDQGCAKCSAECVCLVCSALACKAAVDNALLEMDRQREAHAQKERDLQIQLQAAEQAAEQIPSIRCAAQLLNRSPPSAVLPNMRAVIWVMCSMCCTCNVIIRMFV